MAKRKKRKKSAEDDDALLEGEAVVKKRKKRRRGAEDDALLEGEAPVRRSSRPEGPACLPEVLRLHSAPAFAALTAASGEHSSCTGDALTRFQGKTLIVTSAYSGLGTFEMACHGIIEDLKREWEGMQETCRIITYASTDLSVPCQQVLTNDRSEIRPQHLFRDVLGRLPTQHRLVCSQIQIQAFAERDLLQTRKRLRQICEDEFKEECERLGKYLLLALCRHLHTVHFEETDECLICPGKPQCFINPRRWYPGAEWWEGAGTDCRPWSAMTLTLAGKPKWLSERTLPCLVWFFSCRCYRVDRLFHENSKHFPHEFWARFSTTISRLICGAIISAESLRRMNVAPT